LNSEEKVPLWNKCFIFSTVAILVVKLHSTSSIQCGPWESTPAVDLGVPRRVGSILLNTTDPKSLQFVHKKVTLEVHLLRST